MMNKKLVKVTAGVVASVLSGEALAAHFVECAERCIQRQAQVARPETEVDQRAPALEQARTDDIVSAISAPVSSPKLSYAPHHLWRDRPHG